MINIKIKKLQSSAKIPILATEGSSGYDIYASNEQELIIKSNDKMLVPTGIAFEIPKNFEIQVRSRSGLALKKGVIVFNAPGTIDSDYRGELKIILFNVNKDDFIVTKNMRIAQIVCQKIENIHWEESNILEESNRNNGGFGSTGHN